MGKKVKQDTPPTAAESLEMIRAEWYGLYHGILDDYLHTEDEESVQNLDKLALECMKGATVRVVIELTYPAETEIEQHASRSGIEVVRS